MIFKHTIRAAWFAASLVFTAGAFCQSLDQSVDFSSKGATVKNLLAELSKKTGITFRPSALTGNDVVMVDAKGVTLQVLMDRIAEAVSGTWKKEAGAYTLNRDLDLARKEDREFLEYRAAKIREDIDKGTQELAKQGAFDANKVLSTDTPGRAQIQTGDSEKPISIRIPNGNEAPIGRALSRALAGMNAMDLAAIPQGTRIVYATSPTRMQRQMPGAAMKAIETFIQEQQAYAGAATPSDTAGGSVFFLGGEARPLALQGGFGKALLILYRGPWQDSIQVDLKIADSTGQFRASHSKTLGMEAWRAPNQAGDQKPSAKGDALALSESAKKHAALMGASNQFAPQDTFTFSLSSGGGGAIRVVSGSSLDAPTNVAKLTPELRPIIENPDANEPLSFAVSEFCDAFQKPEGNFVALLPDSLLLPLSARAAQPTTLADLRKLFDDTLAMKVAEHDGWTVVKPRFPSLARAQRVDRAGLASLLNNIGKEGRLSLNSLSGYAKTHMQPSSIGIESIWVGLLYPEAKPTFSSSIFNWKMLQFYAALDPGARVTLRDQGAMPIQGLNASLMATLSNMVYNDPSGPSQRAPSPLPGQGGEAPRQRASISRSVIATGSGPMMPGGMMEFSTSLMDERTEFLPTGVPSGGLLRLNLQDTEGVYAMSDETAGSGRFFSAQEFGAYQGLAEGPMAGNFPQYSAFKPATMTRMAFNFELTQTASLMRQLEENNVDQRSKPVAFQFLSESFRKAAEEAKKRMANANAKMQFGPPGGVNPPPVGPK